MGSSPHSLTLLLGGKERVGYHVPWRDGWGKRETDDFGGPRFFITLAPCPHLNGKHTVFGHIVEGHLIVQMMAKVKVDKQDRPVTDVIIARCGEIEMRGASKKPLPDGAPNVLEEKAKNGEKVIDSSPRRRTDLGPGSADRRLSETIPRDNGSVHQDTDHRRERHARRDDSRDRTRRGRSRARSYSTDIGSASPSKSDSKHASKTDQLHPGQSHSHRERRRKRRRSESPSRSTTPSKRAAGSPDQRRRRHRSHSRQRAHDLQRTPNTGYARYRYGDEYRSYAYDQDTHREDELLLRQQEMVRDGGYDRFEGAVGEDDVESRYKGGYGGIENRRGDGRDHRQAEKASEKSTVKFKGRGRMSYREEGEGRLL